MTSDTPHSERFNDNTHKLFNPFDFGAKGDGMSDDTLPIQQAIDAAAQCNGVVVFEPGEYITGELHLHHGSSLRGELCNRYPYLAEQSCVRLQLREDDTSLIGENLGYYRRSEQHGIAAFDWWQLIRFTRR